MQRSAALSAATAEDARIDRAEADLAALGEMCGDFAIQCSDAAGFVGQVNRRIVDDHASIAALQRNVTGLAALQAEAHGAASEIRQVAHQATGLLTDSHRAALSALAEIGTLIDEVVRMGERLEGFVDSIEQVGAVSGELDGITRQSGMLAINATIEAARAGGSAAGFAVVAAEMKRLAANARGATTSVTQTVARLQGEAQAVVEDIRRGGARARAARTRTGAIGEALETIAALVTQFDQRSAEIEATGGHVTAHVAKLNDGLAGFAAGATLTLGDLDQAREQLDGLESASNAMLDRVAHSGAQTRDTRFVGAALAQAGAVTALVEAALRDGRLGEAALFDTAYRPVEGSDPPQYLTAFVPFADAAIRPLLDRATATDPAIVGCALIDLNGHLPTHITERSRPQRAGDRRWNAEHARNRQKFMDRQTRAALDDAGDYVLFTYRQDLGDGRYRALRSVFVPLAFRGRRWGLYELGYLI